MRNIAAIVQPLKLDDVQEQLQAMEEVVCVRTGERGEAAISACPVL